jgi:hypothetical protein
MHFKKTRIAAWISFTGVGHVTPIAILEKVACLLWKSWENKDSTTAGAFVRLECHLGGIHPLERWICP